VLAQIDPDAAWEKIQAADPAWDRDAAKLPVFRAFLAASPDDARTMIPRIKTPYWRMHSYQELIDALPADQAGRKKEVLAEALLEARKLDDLSLRVGYLSQFARRLADLGETAAARKLADEVQSLFKPLDAINARHEGVRQLATVLGRIDLKAALALIPEGGDERARNDVIGAIAEAVAPTDPAAAEQLIGQFTHNSSEVFTVHVCRRMAPVDLPRARRMAAAIKSNGLRGYASGLMADALASTDLAAAAALLDDSYRAFADAAERGLGGTWAAQGAAVMAASLLPVAERVAPDRFSEFFWRAVSLRWQPRTINDLTMTIPDTSKAEAMRQGAALALYLVRYDRELARALLTPLVEQLLALPPETDALQYEWRLVLMALAQIEPRRAVEVVAAVPNLNEGPDRNIRDSARLTVATALAKDLDRVLDDARTRITDLEILLREDR